MLLWQLGVASSLFDVVIAGLSEDEALRPPVTGAWSVRRGEDDVWRADWADDEPVPAPPTTVAWLLWHIGWWWSDVTGRAFGEGRRGERGGPVLNVARRSLLAADGSAVQPCRGLGQRRAPEERCRDRSDAAHLERPVRSSYRLGHSSGTAEFAVRTPVACHTPLRQLANSVPRGDVS